MVSNGATPPLPARLRFQTVLRSHSESASYSGTSLSFSPAAPLVEGGSLSQGDLCPQRQCFAVRSLRGFRLASGGAEGRHGRTESHHNGNLRHCGNLIIHKGPSVPPQDSVGCRNFSRLMLIEPRNWNLSSLQADSAGAFAGALWDDGLMKRVEAHDCQ